MRLFALLLLAAVAGFGVGRLTAPEEGGRGGERGAAPVAGPVRHEEQIAPDSSAQVASQGDPEPAPTTPLYVVHPTSALDEPGSEGLIEVDFEGYDGERQAWVAWRSIQGAFENWEESAEEGSSTVRFSLDPGTYDVWWLDGQDGRRRGTRASVESGQLTRLRAADHRTVPPVPDGLGILDLEVAATWGGGLETWVDLICSEEASVGINARGHGSAALYPGRYGLVIGDHREEVEIAAGRVTSQRIAHAKEGDLLFEGSDQFDIGIARPAEPVGRRLYSGQSGNWFGVIGGVERRGFVYVAEGEYDVFLLHGSGDKSGVRLGRAAVRAGQTTWFRYGAPRGGLTLRVILPEPGISKGMVVVRRIVDGEQTEDTMTMFEAVGVEGLVDSRESRFTAVLAPGRYSVTASAPDCESQHVDVDVAERMVELSFELVQER